MSLSNDSTTMVMPVAPAYQGGGYGNGCGSMWGGDWASWIILFLIFGMFGWGGYGNFGGGFGGGNGLGSPSGQGWATRADINEGFALNGLQNGQRDITAAISNGFHGVDNAVCQLGYNVQQGVNTLSGQLADCCCTTQRAIDGVNYNMATQVSGIQNAIQGINYNLATGTNSVIQNAHDDTSRVLAKLDAMEAARQQERIAALQAENQSLKFQASQTAQNAFISANQDAQTAELLRRLGRDCPVPAYWVNPPTPVPVPCGTCNTCGC